MTHQNLKQDILKISLARGPRWSTLEVGTGHTVHLPSQSLMLEQTSWNKRGCPSVTNRTHLTKSGRDRRVGKDRMTFLCRCRSMQVFTTDAIGAKSGKSKDQTPLLRRSHLVAVQINRRWEPMGKKKVKPQVWSVVRMEKMYGGQLVSNIGAEAESMSGFLAFPFDFTWQRYLIKHDGTRPK